MTHIKVSRGTYCCQITTEWKKGLYVMNQYCCRISKFDVKGSRNMDVTTLLLYIALPNEYQVFLKVPHPAFKGV